MTRRQWKMWSEHPFRPTYFDCQSKCPIYGNRMPPYQHSRPLLPSQFYSCMLSAQNLSYCHGWWMTLRVVMKLSTRAVDTFSTHKLAFLYMWDFSIASLGSCSALSLNIGFSDGLYSHCGGGNFAARCFWTSRVIALDWVIHSVDKWNSELLGITTTVAGMNSYGMRLFIQIAVPGPAVVAFISLSKDRKSVV